MVEKIFDKMESIRNINQMAAKLKQMGMKDELEKLAVKNGISSEDLGFYLAGKRYVLVDGGGTEKSYTSARSKILDEMLYLKDPVFVDIVGKYLLEQCRNPELEQQILKRHKTLQRCMDYLMEKAWELVDEETKKQQIPVGFAVVSDTVFGWVWDYYALEDEQQVSEKEKETEEAFRKRSMAVTEIQKPAAGKKSRSRSKKQDAAARMKETNTSGQEERKEDGQLSLFDAGMTTA